MPKQANQLQGRKRGERGGERRKWAETPICGALAPPQVLVFLVFTYRTENIDFKKHAQHAQGISKRVFPFYFCLN